MKRLRSSTLKILLVSFIVAGVIAVRLSGVLDHMTLETLKKNGQTFREIVHGHYGIAVLVYMTGYAVSVAASLPGDIVLSIAGGYLFGTLLGAVYINVGATAGALCSFIFSRYVVGDWLQARFKDHLQRFNREVEAHGHLYFLIVRLIPFFPFVLVNLLSGLTKVPFKTYLWTTCLGIIPVSLIYAYAGSQLGIVNSVGDLFTARMLIAFVLLAALTLVPLVVKKIRAKPAR
jgi:uncharacterized membrane protein YdjX (TVP38/TMEM64 family)